MISVSKALQHVEKYCAPGKSVFKRTIDCYGFILAEKIISPLNMPPFRQSSMDGYAFLFSEENVYKIIGEVKAGNSENVSLNPGEAVRIFTGAKVPDDANTVVMQEHVKVIEGTVFIEKMPEKFSNVRPTGEQIKTGETALPMGTFLNEAAIGFLAGLGIAKIKVYEKPKVGLLISGNEIKKIGEELQEGEVYDSNSITLNLALRRIGITEIKTEFAQDTLEDTKNSLAKLIDCCDVILVSGGISVGDYDFTKQALQENGATEIFYKVNQKPGKPLWFGRKNDQFVFALPGNPASSLTCFYVYALPLLKAKMGFLDFHSTKLKAKSASQIQNNSGKTLFLKGRVENGIATEFSGQASSMLKSFALSNALLIVPEDVETIEQGKEIGYVNIN